MTDPQWAITSWERNGQGCAWHYVAQLKQTFPTFEAAQQYQMHLIGEKISQGLGDQYTYHVTQLE